VIAADARRIEMEEPFRAPDPSTELGAAFELAMACSEEADAIALASFRQGVEVEAKPDASFVTAADMAVERMIRTRIRARFPEHGLVGEEYGEELGDPARAGGRRWIIDPIDGTKAFTCGVPLYSTLLALEDAHGVAVGVVHLPALGETVWAGRGLGCWTDRGPARVQGAPTLDGAYVMSSSFDSWRPEWIAAVAGAGAILRTWGDGYGYALVATGRVAAMVDPIVEPYDVGPMPVLLAEAGGRFTDLSGAPTIEGGSGLGTNGLVHDELLALLQD
jgi:histidinol-phosphatase